ncbi:MAG: leucine-rich repeat protein [Oscillospiraceae bacterium]|nr:leucine-rich repeat protein [Oscillospiraceae bacterium]
MKLRSFSLPLAALTMAAALFLLCALPTTADDDAADAETVYTETEQIELDTSSLSDNDTLLEDYVEQLFSLNSGIALSSYGEDYLSGVDLDVYTQLKAAIESIAAGEESSSIVTVSLQYTPDELDAANYDSAYNAFYAQLNRTHVLNYLLYDCPYDFYWFDKSANTTSQLRYTETQELLTVTITYYFPVAEGYQSETKYTVNSEKAAAAVRSAANALAIVEAYDSLSDSEKLSAYKDEICALTSYSTDYATASYGDIWQLVWVFDGDEDTNVVCEGYSKAFQYLCDLSSFDDVLCYTVIGTMNGGTGAGNHMWNVVCLNGVTYMADITNSDSGTIGKNGGLFMVCADDAVSSSSSGYSFLVGSTTIRYIYSSTCLELYGADALTLGSAAEQSGGSTETGTCGENVTWSLDTDTGVLTISGEGEMDNYAVAGTPWYAYRYSITTVVIENGVTNIGGCAFYDCTELTSVTIPDSVIMYIYGINGWAFEGCSSLAEILVSAGNTTYSAEDGVLFDRDKTELMCYPAGKAEIAYEIPDSVASISDCAFEGCSSLTSVTIPDSVTSIGSYAFEGCSSLTSITIPSSVMSIENGVFAACDSLTEIPVSGENAAYSAEDGVLFNKDKTVLVCYPSGKTTSVYKIPESVTSIYTDAFRSCGNLTSVTIPDSVTYIDDSAFYGCSSLTSYC